ncbi:hypothetical protein M758_UG226100 [Ceratodon purpureus]|nr:hypothetical protein M758_UG226100 [Ceratodon purpureus]
MLLTERAVEVGFEVSLAFTNNVSIGFMQGLASPGITLQLTLSVPQGWRPLFLR